MYYIYALTDPRDNLIHYVGLTGGVPTKRLAEHLNDHIGHKADWLSDLIDAAFMPGFIVLQVADDLEQANLRESWWISTGELLGWPLTNIAKTAGRAMASFKKAQSEVKREVVKGVAEARSFAVSVDTGPTNLQSAVWKWRDDNPNGTQADMRRAFAESGIEIARGYAHECWHAWHPSGDRLGTDIAAEVTA